VGALSSPLKRANKNYNTKVKFVKKNYEKKKKIFNSLFLLEKNDVLSF